MDCRQLNEPSEVEAWKVMMDSMIKFIHASTKLMNTYNLKASHQLLPALCELECPPCVESQKKTARRCSANLSQRSNNAAGPTQQPPRRSVDPAGNVISTRSMDQTPSTNATAPGRDVTPIVESTRIGENPPTPIQSEGDETPSTNETAPDRDVTPIVESTRIGENPPTPMQSEGDETPSTNETAPDRDVTPIVESTRIGENPSTPIQSEGDETPSTNETAPDRDVTPIIESTRIGENPPTTMQSEGDETPSTNETAPDRDVTPIVESTRIGEGVPTPGPEKASIAAQGSEKQGDFCICKEVKAIKSIISQVGVSPDAKEGKTGKCGCKAEKSKPQLCACPVTSKETTNITESMVQKLEKAQGEIDGLKEELQKLQFMENAKKSNSAALYKEIMKGAANDSGPPLRICTPARRTATSKTASNTCPSACTPSQNRRFSNAMPPPIRSDNNQTSFPQTSDTRKYGQTVSRFQPMGASTPMSQQRPPNAMQPLATSLGDTICGSGSRCPSKASQQRTAPPGMQSLATSLGDTTYGSVSRRQPMMSSTRMSPAPPGMQSLASSLGDTTYGSVSRRQPMMSSTRMSPAPPGMQSLASSLGDTTYGSVSRRQPMTSSTRMSPAPPGMQSLASTLGDTTYGSAPRCQQVSTSTRMSQPRTPAMMQPLATSSFIGDVTTSGSASRWSPQTPSRGAPLTNVMYNDVQGQGQNREEWYDDCYCPGYDDEQEDFNDDSRFLPAANPMPACPQRQYSEVECVFKRPKEPPQGMINSYRTSIGITSNPFPPNQERIRSSQGTMQSATPVSVPPRHYAQPSMYEDPRNDHGSEEYVDQLCDEYSCGNDECENL